MVYNIRNIPERTDLPCRSVRQMTEQRVERDCGTFRFHAIKTDKFKMSRLSFNFILPADRESSPLTRLTLAVMMRGCRSYPTVIAINKRLDELYGATVTWRAAVVGERHIFKISCETLGNRYRLPGDDTDILYGVAEVVADILLSPLTDESGLLDEANFKSEQKLLIDGIRAKINDQKAYAADRCRAVMLGDHPAGISTEGTEEQVAAFTREQVSENMGHLLHDSLLECYYIGSDDYEPTVSMLQERFGEIEKAPDVVLERERAFVRESGDGVREVTEEMNVSQGRLNIGCTSGVIMQDEGYYAMNVFNEIFGGGSVAKLFMNVRERKSLCYYCYSSYGSATGNIMIGCGIKPENRDKALKEIKKQLVAMQKGDFTEDEIETAKRTVISGLRQISDNPSAIEAFLFRRFLSGVEEEVEDCIAKVEAVSRGEIVEAANQVQIDTVYFLTGNGEEDMSDV